MASRRRLVVGLVLAAAVVVVAAVVAARRNDTSGFFRLSTAGPAGLIGLQDSSGPINGNTFSEIAEARTPMVVNIRSESRRQTRDLSEFFDSGDLLERFFGFQQRPRQPRDQLTQAAGSGFIVDPAGLILTNNHVVAGATRITVALYADEDGREYDARVVGRDPLTDSALIELSEKPTQDLPVAILGRSGEVKPGDWVMAIGNPFNLAHTVTVGVISAIDRPFPISEGRWQDALQTDAAINPGNSGGPLLNLRGEVVGINTAIFTGGPGAGNVGVGFAIPIDAVRDLLPELRQGTITRGRIGVQITPVTSGLAQALGLEEANGALVRMVERDGPAAAAGIEPGDVIVGFDGKSVDESDDLVAMVTRTKPGTTVAVEVVRERERRTMRVTVDALEADDSAASSATPSDTAFGMSVRDLTAQARSQLQLPAGRTGALVTNVEPGGAAARAGIRAGDVLLEVNRAAVTGAAEAVDALRNVREETAFALIWRRGQEQFVVMTRQ